MCLGNRKVSVVELDQDPRAGRTKGILRTFVGTLPPKRPPECYCLECHTTQSRDRVGEEQENPRLPKVQLSQNGAQNRNSLEF